MKRTSAGLIVLGCLLAVAGCTSNSPSPTVTTRDVTSTVVSTRPAPPPAVKGIAFATIAPLPPGAAPAAGEVEKPCPYILSSQDQGPVSMADLEGDRVYRTTVLTRLKPQGCRFYFWAGPFEATAEIAPYTYATAQQAHDAMVLTARVDPAAQGYPNLLPGVDAISFRTKFFGPDGTRDWACAFAKGRLMVVVRTQRFDTSLNARLIVQAIAGKF